MSIASARVVRAVATEAPLSTGAFRRTGIDSPNTGDELPEADAYLSQRGPGRTVIDIGKGRVVFTQGDLADSIFYIQKGWIKLSIASHHGKEKISLHRKGDFFGIECVVTAQRLRLSSATTFTSCTLVRIDKREMLRALAQERFLPNVFLAFLVTRCILLQAELVDHIFNSSEKRLARTLLLLIAFDDEQESVLPYLTHEALAEMVGTTRSRISLFMRRFQKLGYIEYSGTLKIQPSILNVLLHDREKMTSESLQGNRMGLALPHQPAS